MLYRAPITPRLFRVLLLLQSQQDSLRATFDYSCMGEDVNHKRYNDNHNENDALCIVNLSCQAYVY